MTAFKSRNRSLLPTWKKSGQWRVRMWRSLVSGWLKGETMVRDYVAREPVKALGIALCIGVVLGWSIKRP